MAVGLFTLLLSILLFLFFSAGFIPSCTPSTPLYTSFNLSSPPPHLLPILALSLPPSPGRLLYLSQTRNNATVQKQIKTLTTHTHISSVFKSCEIRFYLKWALWSPEMMRGCCLQLWTDGEAGEGSFISFMLAVPISLSIHRAVTSYTTWLHIHKRRQHRWNPIILLSVWIQAFWPTPTHLCACALALIMPCSSIHCPLWPQHLLQWSCETKLFLSGFIQRILTLTCVSPLSDLMLCWLDK